MIQLIDKGAGALAPIAFLPCVPRMIEVTGIIPQKKALRAPGRRLPEEMAKKFIGLRFRTVFSAEHLYKQDIRGRGDNPYPPGTRIAYLDDVLEQLREYGLDDVATFIELTNYTVTSMDRCQFFYFSPGTFKYIDGN